jgi:hypothetical protein
MTAVDVALSLGSSEFGARGAAAPGAKKRGAASP